MKYLYLDHGEGDRSAFTVAWHTGTGRKVKHFTDREEAERFAVSKMGKTGSIISTLDMTPEQLAAHKAREQRFRDAMAEARAR